MFVNKKLKSSSSFAVLLAFLHSIGVHMKYKNFLLDMVI